MNQNPFIVQMKPLFGDEEKRAISEYMDEGGFITEFKRTEKFEKMLTDYTGAKHCIVVNNGTISLTLAAIALGLCHGDEVIVPNYTMVATPNSLKMIGVVPVFVDVEPDTLCLDIEKIKSAITSKTRGIIFVSANGRYPKSGILEIKKIAKEHGLVLLEDAAQSLGSLYPEGNHVGTVGVIGSFSFSAPKIISTGQGGALITNSDELADKLRRLKDFGRSGGGNDVHDTIGYNFKFTELQACVGIEQMKKLPGRVIRKKAIWMAYRRGLSGLEQVNLFNHDLSCTSPWFIDVLADSRDDLVKYLKSVGIGTRTMYPPINLQRAYSLPGNFPVCDEVGRRGLWLPSYVQLSDEEIDRVCLAIHDYYKS